MRFESMVEETIISYLERLDYVLVDGDDLWLQNRQLDEFINEELLLNCLSRINKTNDSEILDEVLRKIKNIDNPSLFEKNKQFHKYLIEGITIDSKKYKINPTIKLVDFENPKNNVFQVVHQVHYKEGSLSQIRIPDVVIYINGIPMVVMELKSFDADNEGATLDNAFAQLGGASENDGYRKDIPTLFIYNTMLVISDGVTTKYGTLTSKINRYNEWKSTHGEKGYDDNFAFKLECNIIGFFEHKTFLDILQNNLFFISDKNDKPVKILTQYHQYFGVIKAEESIVNNKKPKGSGKAGIFWHTQGSGKSFSMVMLTQRLLKNEKLNVPTIVVLTDRIDLDDQLYKTFLSAKEFLRCEPTIVESREDLLNKLPSFKQGGVLFTTIGKFDKENLPKNERDNIIVLTDEAHRSHYGLYEKVSYEKNDKTNEYEAVFKYGIEKYIREALPNATFLGFTGTPVSNKDKQTSDVYGDVIDIYDMTQSIIDGSTVKLYYEARLAKIWANDKVLDQIDEYYKDIEENEKASKEAVDKSKAEMSKIKVILEDDNLIDLLANDILAHYGERKNILNGKAMIVCQTRVAAVKLYKRIIELKNEYKDRIILVVTESNKDTEEMRELFGDSKHRKELGEEFKKDNSKYKIAIVVDMWLTGFDVPDLDTMYFIKKLKSYNLMQAIARVNRVYPGKSSGLIVDYIGLNKALDAALSEYTDRDRKENCQDIKKEIYNILREKLSILNEWFVKIDKQKFNSNESVERFKAIQEGVEFILSDKNREEVFLKDLSINIKQAFAACGGMATEEEKIDTIYYLAIRSYILKLRMGAAPVSIQEMNAHVKELLADAIQGDEVKLLGKNDESINVIELLTKEKMDALRKSNPPHIFIEIVKKLLERAITESRKNNYFKSQEYSKRLRKILEKYNDRDAEFTADVTIAGLVNFASELVSDEKKANDLGITGRERAFYDALVRDKSAKELMSDETLKLIALELKDIVEEYAKTDWSLKLATQANMRIKIKECLKKYGYPPEYRDAAIGDVIEQARYMMV